MTLTEETARELNENLLKVLEVIAPNKRATKKTKKQEGIDAEVERLYKKYLKR